MKKPGFSEFGHSKRRKESSIFSKLRFLTPFRTIEKPVLKKAVKKRGRYPMEPSLAPVKERKVGGNVPSLTLLKNT